MLDKKSAAERFVILGQGISAVSAAVAIRERNKSCEIIMVSEEEYLPYNRPMLTKRLNLLDPGDIAMHNEKWYQDRDITLMNGKKIIALNTEKHEVVFSDNSVLKYDKCIYALGANCFIPPIEGCRLPEVIAIRSVNDVLKVNSIIKDAKSAVVIGGGVLGLEAAWGLKNAGLKVSVIELADRIMIRQLDTVSSEFLANRVKEAGIDIYTGISTDAIAGDEHVKGVRLKDNMLLECEIVIISSGVRANTEIAQKAGIEIGRAINVNEKMETNIKDVYAAGDCAEYNCINYCLWSEAQAMGTVAGANAAGEETIYKSEIPPLYFNGVNTSLYALGNNAIDNEEGYDIILKKDEDNKKLERYCFADKRLCGFILIGDTKKAVALSKALKEGKTLNDLTDLI